MRSLVKWGRESALLNRVFPALKMNLLPPRSKSDQGRPPGEGYRLASGSVSSPVMGIVTLAPVGRYC